MSNKPMLTSGTDERDALIEQQQEEIAALKKENLRLRTEVRQAKESGANSVAALREQMEPWRDAINRLFEQMDAVAPAPAQSGNGERPAANTDQRQLAVWSSWKERLGSTPGKIIDALLVHRELNTQQLAIACGLNRGTIPNGIYALNKAGLINKNGGKFSLKQV